MKIDSKDLGTALLFDEIKVGMKVIIPDMDSQSYDEFEIVTVKVLEPGGIGELMLESNMSDQWFQVEESGYIVPFFPGAIFPLTKKIKTKLLLQGVKNERNKQSDPESVPVINIPF